VDGAAQRGVVAAVAAGDLEGGRVAALEREVTVTKGAGEPLGAEVDAAIFDEVQTCDNHCEFCFIYQLPKGMRRSLYLKDDDYRLSFLYGNFTTLTRFTESDLERVITEGLDPLYVSIHATDPEVRADMLRNRRGATSLRWLRALLDNDVTIHGQVVVCPGINAGAVLESTLAGVLDQYPELATLAVVPLGISDHSNEPRMRYHTATGAAAVLDCVEDWQDVFHAVLGRRLVYAADEYYLLAERPFPEAEVYGDFAMHEDGIGMARTFEAEFRGVADTTTRPAAGFFAWSQTEPGHEQPDPFAADPAPRRQAYDGSRERHQAGFRNSAQRTGGAADLFNRDTEMFTRDRVEVLPSADADEPRSRLYVVQPNDNYWRISQKQYGTGRYFEALARFNEHRVPDPLRLRPGMKVLTPEPEALKSRYPDLFPRAAASASGQADEPPGFFRDASGRPLYRVGRNDTLTHIAHRHLGRASRWVQLYELNRDRLRNPNDLKIGTVLRLPDDASRVQVSR
jgi:nucleoid-associated protein YgaU